ncbi:hypothetical protein [Allochromatium palmeri]|uniref:DUF7931 domain-containing protein n=1 Tax=Allochromatium palmeri TaxID=231048 RepID=A0A6N8EBI8_9GAMM|nr:hypothetical protein [Allochromatium palmeri]MTW21602.1 hypothetical protein [Allochromatium palmeri]
MPNETSLFSTAPDVGSRRLTLTGSQDIAGISADMAARARRELLIYGPTLDPVLYDQAPFLEAIRRLALERPGLCVRVMVFDPRAASQSGHRLIELARRLTSRIAIQRVADEDRDRLDAFLVVDERRYVRRRLADRLEAIADYDDPPAARRLVQEFERLWERSSVDAELRQLFI